MLNSKIKKNQHDLLKKILEEESLILKLAAEITYIEIIGFSVFLILVFAFTILFFINHVK